MNLIQRALTAYFHRIYRDMVDRLLAAEVAIMAPCGAGRHLDLGSHAGENAARLAAAAACRPPGASTMTPACCARAGRRAASPASRPT